MLIKVELSTSGLGLAPVTAPGHPLAALLRDIFHHHRCDTLDAPITTSGRRGGTRGCGKARQEVLSGDRDAGGGREAPGVQFQETRAQRGGRRGRRCIILRFSGPLASCRARATGRRLVAAFSAESPALWRRE